MRADKSTETIITFGAGCLMLVGLMLIVFAMGLALALLWGYVFSLYWWWFITPLTEIQPLPWLQISGVLFVTHSLKTYLFSERIRKDSENAWLNLLIRCTTPLLGLAFGWLLHSIIVNWG